MDKKKLVFWKVFPQLRGNILDKPIQSVEKDELLADKRDLSKAAEKLLNLAEKQEERDLSADENLSFDMASNALAEIDKELDARVARGDMSPSMPRISGT